MFHSISNKLAVTYLLVIIIAFGVVNLLAAQSLENYLLGERRVTLLTQANIVSGGAATIIDSPINLEFLARESSKRFEVRVLILDAGGHVLADAFGSPEFQGKPKLTHPEVIRALQGESVANRHLLPEEGPVMYAATPIVLQKQVVGVVFFSATLDDVYTTLREIALDQLVVSLLALALVVVISLILSRGLTQPISNLREATRKMAAGNFGVRVQVEGRDELAALAQDFNSMAESLDRLEESRRRFIANASHELKTPISSIKALIDPLVGEHRVDEATRRDFLEDIQRQIDRLADLTGELLHLSELERPDRTLNYAPVDLAALADEIVGELRPLAQGQEINLVRTGSPEGVSITGDRRRLSEVLTNLIDNAIKYTGVGGRVEVEVVPVGEGARLRVSDNGQGIPAEALPRIFERFYRVDKARSRATGGTGLGLAIVQQIVKQHGGVIEVESEPGRGTVFTVLLPKGINL